MCATPFFCGFVFAVVFIVPALTALFCSAGVCLFKSIRHSRVEKGIWAGTSAILSLTLVLMWMCALWNTDEIYYHASEIEMYADMRLKYLDFWRKFSAFAPDLYAAKTESDVSVSKLQKLLASSDNDKLFKLGPIHDGRR